MKDTPTRKLAVILHADIVGSTALVQADETQAHHRIRDTFRHLSGIIGDHEGIVHEIRGDALVAEFTRASDAVSAALDFQEQNRARNRKSKNPDRLEVRVGIGLGEEVIADGTITGTGVVLAQRLEQLAQPGSVVLQGAVFEAVPKRFPFTYEYLGEQTLKGFGRPVRAFSVSMARPGAAPPDRDRAPDQEADSSRSTAGAAERGFRIHGWAVRPLEGRLTRDGAERRVSPKAMDVLVALCQQPGKLLSREAILRKVWGRAVSDEPLTRCISELRRQLGDSRKAPAVIETVPKRGYRLIAKVEQLESEPDTAAGTDRGGPPGAGETVHAAAPRGPSVAVLPFVNLGGNPDQDYFAAGITQDIITELSRFRSLFVIANASSAMYKTRDVSAGQAGRELGVSHVLEGSVRRSDNRLRITVQLADTRSGEQVWAERFDRQLGDIFAVQDEITKTVVNCVDRRIVETGQTRARRVDASRLQAYDHVLRAWSHIESINQHDNEQAQRECLAAMHSDADFAPAHALLAVTRVLRPHNGWSRDPASDFAAAVDAANRAVALDPHNHIGYIALGYASLMMQRHDRAGAALRRAVELNPNSADALAFLGGALAYDGRPDEGLQSIHSAMYHNPHYPSWYLQFAARSHYGLADYDSALAMLEQVSTFTPGYTGSLVLRAATYVALGRMDEARAVVREIGARWPDYTLKKVPFSSPYRQAKHMQSYLERVRLAGLREA